MLLGLPAGTWVLILASTLPGLLLVVFVYLVHRGGGGGARGTGQGERPGG